MQGGLELAASASRKERIPYEGKCAGARHGASGCTSRKKCVDEESADVQSTGDGQNSHGESCGDARENEIARCVRSRVWSTAVDGCVVPPRAGASDPDGDSTHRLHGSSFYGDSCYRGDADRTVVHVQRSVHVGVAVFCYGNPLG